MSLSRATCEFRIRKESGPERIGWSFELEGDEVKSGFKTLEVGPNDELKSCDLQKTKLKVWSQN